jgi:hypothetical protein
MKSYHKHCQLILPWSIYEVVFETTTRWQLLTRWKHGEDEVLNIVQQG